MKKSIFAVIVLLNLIWPSFADNQLFMALPKKILSQPRIDGLLDETAWSEAPLVTDFIQFEPQKGNPATVRTEVRIAYDDNHIYFGFKCYDPEPDKLVLGTRRDGLLMGTDSVTVMLDTFHDMRTAYYFRTNPLGVQHDGRVSDNGRVADTNWDGIWESAGILIPEGWSAEIAIPLTTIKHRAGSNQTWGFQTSRYFPRNLEKSFWTGPLEDYRKLDGNGTLNGLDLTRSALRLQFIPYGISRFEEGKKTALEAGLDARYDFTPSVSSHLTVNPDFATVEADQEQVNLTRFELHLPEKRNFFLEGNDIYKQRIQLFYSRRIEDIYGGAKVYGKIASSEFAVLSAQAKGGGSEEESANFTVFRLKQDVLNNSTFGILAANKMKNGRNQGTAGLDTALYFTKTFKFTGQLAVSYGDAGRTDVGLFLRPSFDSSSFHIHLRYTYLGRDFGDNANAVGFIRDDNRHELDSAIRKIFWPGGSLFDRIEYSSNYNIYWGMDKTLRSWDIWQALIFDLRNKLSFKLRHEEEYKLYEKGFRNRETQFTAGYNMREWESMVFSYSFGKNFDSDFSLLGASMSHKLTNDLSLTYRLSKLYLNPDPDGQSTWIHSLYATQYFHKDLFLRLFFQTNLAIDKRNIQIVFAYRFQPPFGLIQLVYQKGTGRFGEKGDQGHTLFFKIAYVF
ncbi:MAG: carbohydrate binding family 9 domain-containing protein [Candidatus Aminicenantes bacterium]|nr:MAG: carbohydrate binding family 9 domain-containing protein [Candidatus Aminicenantes bacterium]